MMKNHFLIVIIEQELALSCTCIDILKICKPERMTTDQSEQLDGEYRRGNSENLFLVFQRAYGISLPEAQLSKYLQCHGVIQFTCETCNRAQERIFLNMKSTSFSRQFNEIVSTARFQSSSKGLS